MTNDIKEYLDINIYKLEEEWQNQSLLFKEYCEVAVNATLAYDEAKTELARMEAIIVLDIVERPEVYTKAKITVKIQEALITTNPKYEEIRKELAQKKWEKKTADDDVKSMEQRKSSLENMVKLYGQNYYSLKPQNEPEFNEDMDEIKKHNINEQIAKVNTQKQEGIK